MPSAVNLLGEGSIWVMNPGDDGDVTPLAALRTFTENDQIYINDNYLIGDSSEPLELEIVGPSDIVFPIRKVIYVRQLSAGQITLVASGGTVLRTPSTLATRIPGSTIALIQVELGVWDVTGDLDVDCGCDPD